MQLKLDGRHVLLPQHAFARQGGGEWTNLTSPGWSVIAGGLPCRERLQRVLGSDVGCSVHLRTPEQEPRPKKRSAWSVCVL